MTKQHKALELALEIEGIVESGCYGIGGPADRAAAELRRQHALIVQMREALAQIEAATKSTWVNVDWVHRHAMKTNAAANEYLEQP